MATGRPGKWVTARITEPVALGKTGISVVVWDKWGKTRRGTLTVSVGGVRWHPYKTRKASRMNWERFADIIESSGYLK
jgi:hypothetical protein